MTSTEQCYLVPDNKVLLEIFSVPVKPTSCRIISNTHNTCTFSLTESFPDYPSHVIVRLEISGGRLAAIATFQRICHSQLLNLVPAVLCVGTATTEDARQVEYSVSAYCEGTIPLENVWDTLDKTHQLELVDSVVHAMEKLQQVDVHSISPNLPGNTNILNSTANWPAKWLGGPSLGYYPDVKHFLDSLLNMGSRRSPTCKLLELNGGVVVASSYDDIGQVELSQADLEKLQSHAVCCHNDLEPRNILVTKLSSTPGNERYELTALVDWEMAGFYPFSYEYSLKDLVLGSSNLSLGWYTLFKERTAHLLPPDECHTRFIKALEIIDGSRKRRMVRNVGVRFQAKWIEREQVTMSPDLRQGWVRKFDTKPPKPFTKDDAEIMEQEVLRELGYS